MGVIGELHVGKPGGVGVCVCGECVCVVCGGVGPVQKVNPQML